MVVLHIKICDESIFLFEASLTDVVKDIIKQISNIYNGVLKVQRICAEMESLRNYGAYKFDSSSDSIEDQLAEMNLSDEQFAPKGGYEENIDPSDFRNGKSPKDDMKKVLDGVIAEAKGNVSLELLKSNVCLSFQHILDALSILQGGVRIVYPGGLPPEDPIMKEFENREDLSGSEDAKKILDPVSTCLWFASKKLEPDKRLSDYFGRNEKTKVVVKVTSRSSHPPAREPLLSEEERKKLMISEFRRREELKKLEEDDDSSYLNSDWADNLLLKKSFHGIQNVSWKPH